MLILTSMEIKYEDIRPSESPFKLQNFPDKTFSLRPVSLLDRIWLNENFGQEEIKRIFLQQDFKGIGTIAYQLLKDKEEFPDLNSFFSQIIGPADLLAIITALMKSVGVDNALMKKMGATVDEKKPKPQKGRKRTGGNSMTSSRKNTRTRSKRSSR